MLKRVKITQVYVNDAPKQKDGEPAPEPYVYKTGKYEGKHFQRVAIKMEEMGDEVYTTNTLPGSKPTTIQSGETYLLKLEKNGDFNNFSFPTQAEVKVYEDLTGAEAQQ